MLTQTSPTELYFIQAPLQLTGPTEKPANESKRLTRLKNALLTLSFPLTLETGAVGGHQIQFTATPKCFLPFARLAHQLAVENTAFITTISITERAVGLEGLGDDDWVYFNDPLPAQLGHEGGQVHAIRIPAGTHFISHGTGVSEQAAAWLKANVGGGYETRPLVNASPVAGPEWSMLMPSAFVGAGLDHPWRPTRDAAGQKTPGLPGVTLGVEPASSGGLRYPVDKKKLHEDANARAGVVLTDPALTALAQATVNRTLSILGPYTLLRGQIPANTEIAWFVVKGKTVAATKARVANALIGAGLATPELFTAFRVVDAPPEGASAISGVPEIPHGSGKTAASVATEKIKDPTFEHVVQVLADFVSVYRKPERRPDWRALYRRYPAMQAATLPELWVKVAALPGADGLLAKLSQNTKRFKGHIENPERLPAHSRLIEVATDGAGDTFILIAPVALEGVETPAAWVDCPVAWHDHGRNEIVCVWPSIAHFALDRLAQQRAVMGE